MTSGEEPGWDWNDDRTRSLMHQVADRCADVLRDGRTGPVTRPIPAELLREIRRTPLPVEPSPEAEVLSDFGRQVQPFPFGNAHPRFAAWVNSPPHPVGVAAAALAAALNPSVAGGRHAAVHIEHLVVGWFQELAGWPAESTGLFVSGGSAATITALTVARRAAFVRAGIDDRRNGATGSAVRPVVYATAEAHSCITRAVELCGIGSANIVRIPTDDHRRMLVADLTARLDEDLAAGRLPVAVVASAGTVNTGAIDPIDAIARICAARGVWLHVDGAYGAPAVLLLERYSDVQAGLARADSIALDPHKWLYTPVDAGLVLLRDAALARDTFSLVPPYLRSEPADDEPTWLSEYGPEQTRSFRALKVWMQLRHLGVDGYRTLIARDIEAADQLCRAVDDSADFELLAHGLSVVCFRHRPPELDDNDVDAHNRELVGLLQRSGQAFLAATEVDGRAALRACVVNPLTTGGELREMLETVRRLAADR